MRQNKRVTQNCKCRLLKFRKSYQTCGRPEPQHRGKAGQTQQGLSWNRWPNYSQPSPHTSNSQEQTLTGGARRCECGPRLPTSTLLKTQCKQLLPQNTQRWSWKRRSETKLWERVLTWHSKHTYSWLLQSFESKVVYFLAVWCGILSTPSQGFLPKRIVAIPVKAPNGIPSSRNFRVTQRPRLCNLQGDQWNAIINAPKSDRMYPLPRKAWLAEN